MIHLGGVGFCTTTRLDRVHLLPCVAMSAQAIGEVRPAVGREMWCAIYVRISQDWIGTGLGVQRQEEDCRALAERKGWHVYKVYVDNDTSAYKGKARKAWNQLLADIRDGKVNSLIGWHVDRLTRHPKELETIIEMAADYKLQLATVAGEIDLATAMGQLMARTMGNIARYESQHKGDRVSRQQQQAAEEGKPYTRGLRCFGFNRDGSVRTEEADILREVVAGVLAGDSVYKWVTLLNERGVKTSRNNPWSQTGMKILLKNPRLAGKRVHRGQIVADGKWEPIITMKEHTRLKTLLTNTGNTWPGAAPATNRKRKFLLTGGIARCGLCGKAMQPKQGTAGKPGLACRTREPSFGCGKVRLSQGTELEEYVAVKVLGRLANPKIMTRLQAAVGTSSETGEILAEEIGEIEDQLADLGVMWAKKEINETAFKAAQATLTSQLQAARAQVVEAVRMDALPDVLHPNAAGDVADRAEQLARWWQEGSTVQERHDLVATLIESVEILPSTRVGFREFDEERIRINWRGVTGDPEH